MENSLSYSTFAKTCPFYTLFIIYSSYIFLIWPLLEAKAEKQKYFGSFSGSNVNFQICFQDLLTFTQRRGNFSGICFKLYSQCNGLGSMPIAIFIASKHTVTLTEQTSLKRCSFYTDSFRTDVYPLMFFKLLLVDL